MRTITSASALVALVLALAALILMPDGALAQEPEDDYPYVFLEGGNLGHVAVGGSVTGVIETAGDLDWFSVSLQQVRSYRVELRGIATGEGTLADPIIQGVYLYAEELDGTRQGAGGVGTNAQLELTAAESTQYFIVAASADGGTGGYTLSVSDSHTAWSGSVSVGYADDAGRMQGLLRVGGEAYGFNSMFGLGTLTPARFNWQGAEYEVVALGLIVSGQTRRLELLTRPELPPGFNLVLGHASFAVGPAERPSGAGAAYRWGDVELSWTEGETITVSLTSPYPELTLALSSSRELCTANTLTELSWIITGGQPPYRLTIGGKRVDQEAQSHRVNCGPIPTDPLTGDPLPDPKKRFDATVRDSQATPSTASASTRVDLAPPLPAPSISYASHEGFVIIGSDWNHAADHSITSLLIRFRETDADAWDYALHPSGRLRRPEYELPVTSGDRAAATAAMRDVIESETPDSLNWSGAVRLASAVAPQNVIATATHDTISVSWDKQPYMSGQRWVVSLTSDSFNGVWSKSLGQVVAETGRHEIDFPGVAPDTTYTISLRIAVPDGKQISRTSVSTSSPPSWIPPPRGPQNLRATAAHDSITVSWDLPHPDARDYWLVRLFEESSGHEWNFTAYRRREDLDRSRCPQRGPACGGYSLPDSGFSDHLGS